MKLPASSQLTDQAFWQFSLAVYARKGIASQCLFLQDTYGANVNLCLLVLWCDSLGLTLSPHDVASLEAKIKRNDHALQVFRMQRREAKVAEPDKYEDYKQQELVLEQQQQKLLVECLIELNTAEVRTSAPDNLSNTQVLIAHYHWQNQQQAQQAIDVIFNTV